MKICLICGENHDEKEKCKPEAFALIICNNCGNESLMPWDACFGLGSMSCGQCGKENDWDQIEDFKKHWENY